MLKFFKDNKNVICDLSIVLLRFVTQKIYLLRNMLIKYLSYTILTFLIINI